MEPGRKVGSLVIESRIGEGGMGVVYRARDTRLNRTVAIKFLSDSLSDPAARRRFQTEARMASALNHPHILTVYDAGEFNGQEFIVTEFVDGGTFQNFHGDWRQAVELLAGIADGLAAAHEAGMLHRDIKPGNILLTKNGYAKLSDFGLAKLSANSPDDETITRTGAVMGTIPYMSPEQASGKKLDARSDIFSFGVVLYEALAAKRPFSGASNVDVLHAIVHRKPADLPGQIPAELRAVVGKALEKDPERRYPSMKELAADLRRTLTPVQAARKTSRIWIAAGIAFVLVLAATAAWRFWPSHSGTAQIRSVAVLPFRNLSGDPNQEFFSDGATEELISILGQLHSFEKVISRTSIMRYKGSTQTIPQIGKELGVDGVIEGSIERMGSHVRVRAQLIQAGTDAEVWSREYDRDSSDLLSLEQEVAHAIAQEIRLQVTPQEQERLTRERKVDPVAHEQYLLGQYHVSRFNLSDAQAAIAFFEKATQIQPDYAEAWAGLGEAWSLLNTFGSVTDEEAVHHMHEYAEKAQTFDPNLPRAHVLLALTAHRTDKSGRIYRSLDLDELKKAIDLDPNVAETYMYMAAYYEGIRSFPEGIAAAERAAALDPASSVIQGGAAYWMYIARQYDKAERYNQRAAELDPQSANHPVLQAAIYRQQGRLPEALAACGQSERMGGKNYSWCSARIYALMGRRQEALKALGVPAAPDERNPAASKIALVYFALGDKDRGFEYLKKAALRVQSWSPYEPDFDDVASDPRFKEIAQSMGYAE
jgi:serine/threonine protein kinase/tetratricopeptide (TPR) repeat protein